MGSFGRVSAFLFAASVLIYIAVSCGDKPPEPTDEGGRFFPLDVKTAYV